MNDSAPSIHSEVTQLIQAIHASDYQAVVAVTGGGSHAISQLLMVPGASRTILEARIPYAPSAFEDWLNGWTGQACSGPAARAMAMTAWERARQLAPAANPQRWVGLACTASLATDRPKQGAHRIHVAVQTASHTGLISLTLHKGARNRIQEEQVAAHMLLGMLAQVCVVEIAPNFPMVQKLLKSGERLETTRQAAPSAWTELLLGQRQWLGHAGGPLGTKEGQSLRTDQENFSPLASPPILFPGAFNPPHAGHLRIARLAAERLQGTVHWELSIRNVDKPTLDFVEIARRLAELQTLGNPPGGRNRTDQEPGICQGVVLTAAPTFLDKARLFPGSLFVVGADTITRIGELRYYHHNQRQRDQTLDELASLGCRFLVFGRLMVDAPDHQVQNLREGQAVENSQVSFRTLGELQLPDSLRALCQEMTAAEFRFDICSRDLRG